MRIEQWNAQNQNRQGNLLCTRIELRNPSRKMNVAKHANIAGKQVLRADTLMRFAIIWGLWVNPGHASLDWNVRHTRCGKIKGGIHEIDCTDRWAKQQKEREQEGD